LMFGERSVEAPSHEARPTHLSQEGSQF
jgi:hypothetical protein